MRIASVVCVYPPYRGGIGHAAQRQAAILSALGHEVVVYCPAPPGEPSRDEVIDGIRVRRLKAVISYGNSAFLPQLLGRMGGHDALFLHYPFFGGAESAVLGIRCRRRPYVAFFHMDVFGSGARGAFLAAYQRTVGRLLLRCARSVLVSSDDYFRHSLQAGAVRRTEAAPYGIDTVRYSPAAVAAGDRERLGIPGDRPLILFVGGMDAPHAFKGVPQLLEAFAYAGLAGRARLSLVGEGELRDGFMARARSLGIDRDVRFHGRASEDDLIALYRAADVAVLPSTTAEEAFGLVLIEAMACRTAVVASRLPGVRDVVGEGAEAGGLLVGAGDVSGLAGALDTLASDGDMRDTLAERGLVRVRERFSLEVERDRLGHIVERYLSRSPARRMPSASGGALVGSSAMALPRRLMQRASTSQAGRWGIDRACAARDAVDRATGRADPLVPPTRLMFDGPRSVRAYRDNGREFLSYFRSIGGLRPDEDVLDVGSGIGRKALPLTSFLAPTARYEGFDINPVGVEWCRKAISSRFPNFTFQLADVRNAHYNPTGGSSAAEYVFPFADGSFDFVFLGSVFTHLVPEDLENYVGQIARVLRPGGRMLGTFFLLDDVTERLTREGRAAYDFRHERPGHRIVDADDPEYAVAYSVDDVLDVVHRHGLEADAESLYLGSWSGRPYGLSFQDILVATKPGAPS